MRTKLFLAFLVVICLSLLSNLIFSYLIQKDFEEYIKGEKEDRVYLLLAAIESTYDRGFDRVKLANALHWAMMLGFEAYVKDRDGAIVMHSVDIFKNLSGPMKRRMEALFRLPYGEGEFRWYPLYQKTEGIGSLYVRPLRPLGLQAEKAEIFKSRSKNFLFTSLAIAGTGALSIAIGLLFFISRPVKKLYEATLRVREGDFSVQIEKRDSPLRKFFHIYDEIDMLIEHFNYMVQALKKEDEARRQMAATVAHELRTPLTVIRGSIEAYEDGLIESPERFIEAMKKEMDRLLKLVENLDDLKSAQESFFKKGPSEEIELSDFIKQLVEPFRPMITEKNLSLELKGSPAKVKTYPEKLAIIIKNLLSNAVQWTEKGGITVRWEKEGRGFYIEVHDTGPGIRKEDHERIFEKFYKGPNSTGRGLGLFIARELTLSIGGEIFVESTPGRGSVFRVVFNG